MPDDAGPPAGGSGGTGDPPDGGDNGPSARPGEPDGEDPGEVVPTRTPGGTVDVRINVQEGQTPGALGAEFAPGVHYADTFEHVHESTTARRLAAEGADVRALDAAHGRADALGNPDIMVRMDPTDVGAYGDLKRLTANPSADRKDPDLSRRVEVNLRSGFSQDPRNRIVALDGTDAGLTTAGAVRGIRRALGFWRQQGRQVTSDMRMVVFTAEGKTVTWQASSGVIDVSS